MTAFALAPPRPATYFPYDPTPLGEQDTATLVRAAQTGDRDAFGELAVRFEPMVRAVATRRLGNPSEAAELTQEVLLRAMDRLHQLTQPQAFGGWLKSITVRMAINRQTRRRRAIDAEPRTLEETCVDNASPFEAAVANERAAQVRDGLDRLGAMDRDTLVAFYVRGESLIEMSDAFRAPVGTIKRRLHVARKRLAAELGEMVSV
ncbi:RNA polymerase sigma factor [Botrimarina hoheduenensis]|uniref:ECF RNA polymerase sigma factor SigW n=1 Tax=Botrimarina hoheduenensis TaxID=2528000 RepID=A0A5C5W950_9BACT|nr:sigma-70 family RNA polymerase sigma factor [Botrimarina hoheduenensis]TWT46803.1 ECF RNA polymerase sigma factor SigW [Botrimarina hoheduenensis]